MSIFRDQNLNDAYRQESDANVRERILLIRRIRIVKTWSVTCECRPFEPVTFDKEKTKNKRKLHFEIL